MIEVRTMIRFAVSDVKLRIKRAGSAFGSGGRFALIRQRHVGLFSCPFDMAPTFRCG
ncbi:hypothetical protein [Azospirillum sp. B506]|uniref:hypothetical protein n=1 Tax=Azospirillum sp. B506 TaxID=137721 RepID=UPI00131F14E9|nr:hypothetical protein [Azospirillum sp. B506]